MHSTVGGAPLCLWTPPFFFLEFLSIVHFTYQHHHRKAEVIFQQPLVQWQDKNPTFESKQNSLYYYSLSLTNRFESLSSERVSFRKWHK